MAVVLISSVELIAMDNRGLKHVRELRADRRFDEANQQLEAMITAADDAKERDFYTIIAVDLADRNLEDTTRAFELAETIADTDRRDFTKLQLLARHGKRAEALALATERDRNNVSWPADSRGAAYRILGDLYLAENDQAAALARYREAAITPATSTVDRGRSAQRAGMIYLSRGNRAKAEEMFRQALAISPAHYAWRNECTITLCQLLIQDQRAPEAIEVLDTVDFQKVGNTWKTTLLKLYYQALLDDGQKINAIRLLDKALLDPAIPKDSKQWIDKALDKLADEM